MFVPFVFTLDERPWSKNHAQADIFYIYADACIEYGWPLIAPERYFDRFIGVEDPLWGIDLFSMEFFTRRFCLRKKPEINDMLSIKTYAIAQQFEDTMVSKYASKMDCLNDLLTNENVEFEKVIGALLDSIANDFGETPEGILCFEVLPKALASAAKKRDIPVIYQLNALMRKPLYTSINHPDSLAINSMSIKYDSALESIRSRYERYLTECKDLPLLSRKGIMRLFFSKNFLKDIHNIDNEPEYDIGVFCNSTPTPMCILGQKPVSDEYINIHARSAYSKVLLRGRPSYSKYEKLDVTDDSPSGFHFCCKCKHIVGSLTKGMFDAMLTGRIAHDYGSFIFDIFCNDGINDNSVGVAPIEFINFVVFVLWSPAPWLTDITNLRLVLSETSDREIYIRNYNYCTQQISKEDLEFYYATENRSYRLGDSLYFTQEHKPHEYASFYCIDGVHETQAGHVWSNGSETRFELNLTEPISEPLIFSVVLHEAVLDWSTSHPTQSVRCVVNDFDCGTVTLTQGSKYIRFTIPLECVTDKLNITLSYGFLFKSGDFDIAVAFREMYISASGQRVIEDEQALAISSMSTHIAELCASSTEMQKKNSKLCSKINELNDKNTELDHCLSMLSDQVTLQNHQIAALESTRFELTSLATTLYERISSLESANKQLDHQIESIFSSNSWKFGNGVMKLVGKFNPKKK